MTNEGEYMSVADEDTESDVDYALLCYAELLYRCKLCHAKNTNVIFKRQQNLIQHIHSAHACYANRLARCFTNEQCNDDDDAKDVVLPPEKQNELEDEEEADDVSSHINIVPASPFSNPSASLPGTPTCEVIDYGTEPSRLSDDLHDTSGNDAAPSLLQSMLSKSACAIKLASEHKDTTVKHGEEHISDRTESVNGTLTKGGGAHQLLNRSKRKNSVPMRIPACDANLPPEKRRLLSRSTTPVQSSEQHEYPAIKKEPDDDYDNRHAKQSVIHYKPTETMTDDTDRAKDSKQNLQGEPLSLHLITENEQEPSKPDQLLFATLRNILNTASHTAAKGSAIDQDDLDQDDDMIDDEMLNQKIFTATGDDLLTDSLHISEFTKVCKLASLLKDFVQVKDDGIVSRDDLLMRLSEQGLVSDCSAWGSACNKAIRDLYPEAYAARKGKFKKTFYFGIELIHEDTVCEDVQNIREKLTKVKGIDHKVYEVDLDVCKMGKEVQTLMREIPRICRWNGSPDTLVSRDILLHILSTTNDTAPFAEWGTACNKAVRQLYPYVIIKRRGKYKTTCFYGLELKPEMQDVCETLSLDLDINQLTWTHSPAAGAAATTPTSRLHKIHTKTPTTSAKGNSSTTLGPPVVNVLSINQNEQKGALSKLPHSTRDLSSRLEHESESSDSGNDTSNTR